jgi:hypothetical protein
MYSVQAHVGRNRLYVTFAGEMTEAEFGAALEEISSALGRLQTGFDLLADITALKPLPEGVLPGIRQTAALMRDKGLRRAVRIVGKATAAAVQFERATRIEGYGAYLAFSREEAERVLDGALPVEAPSRSSA